MRRAGLPAILSLLWSAGAPAQPSGESALESFRITAPVAVAEALREFDAICLKSFPDPDAFAAAVDSSNWRYERHAGWSTGSKQSWMAASGLASFDTPGQLPKGLALPQCNLDTGTAESVTRDDVVSGVERMLLAQLGQIPTRANSAKAIFWSWPLDGEHVAKLYLMGYDNPRQISLSLQYWDPRFEQPWATTTGSTLEKK